MKTLNDPFICEALIWSKETETGTSFHASSPPQVRITQTPYGYGDNRLWTLKSSGKGLGRIQALVLDKKGFLKVEHDPSGNVLVRTRDRGWRKTGSVKLLLRIERIIQPSLVRVDGLPGIEKLTLTLGCALPKVLGIGSDLKLRDTNTIRYQRGDEAGTVCCNSGEFAIQLLDRERSGFQFMSINPSAFDLPGVEQQRDIDLTNSCPIRIEQLDPWTAQVWTDQRILDQLPDGTRLEFEIYLVRGPYRTAEPAPIPPAPESEDPPPSAEPELEF